MNIKSEKLLTILLNIVFGIYVIILIWAIALKCNMSQAYIDTYEFLIDKSFINRFTVYFTPPHKYLISLFNRSFFSILEEEINNIKNLLVEFSGTVRCVEVPDKGYIYSVAHM